MEQRPGETSCSTAQDIPSLLRMWTVYYHIHKIPPQDTNPMEQIRREGNSRSAGRYIAPFTKLKGVTV
jgi:hypothetical protein